jgi:nitrate reductase NapE component
MNARLVSSSEFPDVARDAAAKKGCSEHHGATGLRSVFKGCVAGIVLVAMIGAVGYLVWDHASKQAQAEADASGTRAVPITHSPWESLSRIAK